MVREVAAIASRYLAFRRSVPRAERGVLAAKPGRFGPFLRGFFAFAGPGYLVAVGYMDPGNWATDLQAGSLYGYALLWVVLAASAMAIVLQVLSARLGIVTGLDLAQACRRVYGRRTNLLLWLAAELGIIACDLAEVLGTAIALKLLFGLPLLAGVALTIVDVLVVLTGQRRGMRRLELIVVGMITLVALSLGIELARAGFDLGAATAALVPRIGQWSNAGTVVAAVGIIGATVMPHNLYLHSSLARERAHEASAGTGRATVLRFAMLDSVVALSLAFLVNAAILILAASVFHGRGAGEVADLEQAYQLMAPLLGGPAAAALFAIGLLAAGQNSALTGTIAGQIVMEGFLGLRWPVWARRLVTRAIAIVPTGCIVAIWGDSSTTEMIVISQIVLSLQLPFAMIPLIRFTADRRLMGEEVRPWLSAAAWVVAALIIAGNAALIYQAF